MNEPTCKSSATGSIGAAVNEPGAAAVLWSEVVMVQKQVFRADPGWVTMKREDDGVCQSTEERAFWRVAVRGRPELHERCGKGGPTRSLKIQPGGRETS